MIMIMVVMMSLKIEEELWSGHDNVGDDAENPR